MTITTERPARRGPLRSSVLTAGLLAGLAGAAAAQDAASDAAESPEFLALAEEQGAANAEPGARQVPARTAPIPTEGVSPAAQALIGAPYSPFWNAVGATPEEWRAFEEQSAAATEPLLAELREALGVTLEEATIGGVPVLILAPEAIPGAHAGQTVLNLHGGGYVYGSGVSGTFEATLLAAHGGYRVIAVDYRMPPDAPYPAAVDDAAAVYAALLDEGADPASIAVNGTSAGGGLALSLLLRLKDEGLPQPGALAANTPWADLTGSGDSYRTNEWLDNVVVSYDGYLDDAARLYAGEADLADPGVSPLFGDLAGLPPTLLISGTRDLFLSDSVRVQRKLRQAGVVAELQMFEGHSHATYLADPAAPETVEMFGEIAAFLDAQLGADRKHDESPRAAPLGGAMAGPEPHDPGRDPGTSQRKERRMSEASSQRGLSRRSFLSTAAAAPVAGALLAPMPAVAQAATAIPPGAAVAMTLQVNGRPYAFAADLRTTLLDAVRERVGLTGSKKGCDHGQCGACTMLVDGRRVLGCLTLAVSAQGAEVTTIEGLATPDGTLHPMQEAFVAHDAYQCGYCTPGQIMSAVACVAEGHAGSDDEIREWMSGNLCRCAAYPNIVAAINQAKTEMEA